MILRESLVFHVGSSVRYLDLFEGDITALPLGQQYDVLAVSAFRHDYKTTSSSVIGALDRRGVSVAELAAKPQTDLREYWHCWMSNPVGAGHGFKQLLCSERASHEPIKSVIEGIFRCLGPFVSRRDGPRSVVMSVPGVGDQGLPVATVFAELLSASYDALELTPLERISIVELSTERANTLEGLFREFKKGAVGKPTRHGLPEVKNDVFVSYASVDEADAVRVEEALIEQQPRLRVYRYAGRLPEGHDYRRELDVEVRASGCVVPLYTPAYLASANCQTEFNSAYNLSSMRPGILFPVLLRSRSASGQQVDVPHLDGDWRKTTLQWADCLEADEQKLQRACKRIAERVVANNGTCRRHG